MSEKYWGEGGVGEREFEGGRKREGERERVRDRVKYAIVRKHMSAIRKLYGRFILYIVLAYFASSATP